jgi:hypothetical protein
MRNLGRIIVDEIRSSEYVDLLLSFDYDDTNGYLSINGTIPADISLSFYLMSEYTGIIFVSLMKIFLIQITTHSRFIRL